MLDIAKARDGRIILYATSGKINEVGNVNVSSLEIRGSRPNSNFRNSITQRDTDVNKKYSRQRLNDTWDDIRDKMYENEVHEDIIGEIEAYIKKLTTRKLVFTDKNKADELLARVGIQPSERSRIINLVKDNLS